MLKTKYNAEKTKYEAVVAGTSKEKEKADDEKFKDFFTPVWKTASSIPLLPAVPTQPAEYKGLRIKPSAIGTADALNQAIVSSAYGGWGALTMGLLTPKSMHEKSFGIIGTTKSTLSPAFDASAQGYLAKA